MSDSERDVVPLVQRDVDVTVFPYMPLDINRLLTSETWIEAAGDGKLGHALICLWCESWRQVPAASLPNNDAVLARLAMCDISKWSEIKEKAMSGFVLCSDNRFYHPVVAEKAINAWNEKIARKERTKAATAAKQQKLLNRKKRSSR